MMKNHRALPNRSAKSDEETIVQIKSSLKSFDDSISIEVPQASFFENSIALQREKARKEWRKEMLMFIGTAAIILSFLFLSFFHQPEVFLTLQVVSLVFVSVYTVYVKRKEESSHE